ncbi:hypothetical protein LRS10_21345 [Phenylobacterium sp. J426]|uniref:hypothetical protein n=1 Tax=Phenylobacterium sp. J426 TaxID=2898439 RepID=UPI002151C52B|nr:hypothetical protein [Phenylobacterium sp. J426]MCR5876464.1 hypothetical protein [Phenylobacterium sp. J426]
MREAQRLSLAFGLMSLAAVAAGAWICARHDVPASVWGRNLAAWLGGGLVALAIARWAGARFLAGVLVASVAGLVATFASAGQLGVHRWVGLGPLTVNVAMLLAPAALVSVAVMRQRLWPWLAALAGLGLLVLQPDASQATAFAAALIALALRRGEGAPRRRAFAALSAALAAVAWLRPDPLEPVPEVEQILQLAYAVAPTAAGFALVALLAAAAAPGVLARNGGADAQAAGFALSVYLLLTALMPFLGAFPTPLVGVGLSPVLGWWLGLGALAAVVRRSSCAERAAASPRA